MLITDYRLQILAYCLFEEEEMRNKILKKMFCSNSQIPIAKSEVGKHTYLKFLSFDLLCTTGTACHIPLRILQIIATQNINFRRFLIFHDDDDDEFDATRATC